jgi:hypothetical protein
LASGQDWLSKFKRKHADLYEAAADANSKAAAAKHTPTASRRRRIRETLSSATFSLPRIVETQRSRLATRARV